MARRLSPLPRDDRQDRGREPPVLDPRLIHDEDQLPSALARIAALCRDEARALYRKLHRRPAPPAFSHDLTVRACAYRLQEQVLGGLSPETRLLLDRLARGKAQGRWIKPGSTIVRSWRGATHQVTVTPDGFLWNGAVHGSLSEIARAITGTRWNGPRFFGLRSARPAVPDDEPPASPRPRGRPRKTSVSPEQPSPAEARHGL